MRVDMQKEEGRSSSASSRVELHSFSPQGLHVQATPHHTLEFIAITLSNTVVTIPWSPCVHFVVERGQPPPATRTRANPCIPVPIFVSKDRISGVHIGKHSAYW